MKRPSDQWCWFIFNSHNNLSRDWAVQVTHRHGRRMIVTYGSQNCLRWLFHCWRLGQAGSRCSSRSDRRWYTSQGRNAVVLSFSLSHRLLPSLLCKHRCNLRLCRSPNKIWVCLNLCTRSRSLSRRLPARSRPLRCFCIICSISSDMASERSGQCQTGTKRLSTPCERTHLWSRIQSFTN